MRNKVRLLPLIICVAVGMAQGFYDVVGVLRSSEYVSHGLYNTALSILVRAIDLRVAAAMAACVIIWLAYTAGSRVRKVLRPACGLGILLGILLLVNSNPFTTAHRLGGWVQQAIRGINSGVLTDFIASGLYQIIASVLILAAGLWILARIRTKHSHRQSVSSQAASGRWASVRSAARHLRAVLDALWELNAIVLIPFIGLNLAAGWYRTSNALALRNLPNVILIQVDTLRPDHLGCYGYQRSTSPNIDRFAGESIRFSKAISAAPWTTASMAQYMSSRNLRVTYGKPFSAVPVNAVEISQALKDRGYATAGVNSNLMAGSYTGFARGLDSYDERYVDISSPAVVSTALERLKQMKGRRFYLFSLFMDPHAPYRLHDGHNFYPGYKGKLGKQINMEALNSPKGLLPDDLKYIESVYDSEIAFTDEYIGHLFGELKKMGLYDNTLIILLADHGEEFGEHGRFKHGTDLYDETLSVPLIIKLPGQHKGKVVDGAFPLLDLFPSIMDTLGMDWSSFGLQGSARHLEALTKARDEGIYSSTDFAGSKQECIRKESYKLIEDQVSSARELYGLKTDAAEKHNIRSSNPAIVSILHKALKERDIEIDSAELSANYHKTADLLTTKSKQLRALGYLQ